LKNISGSEINLNGWQLLDKDNQIKVIFPDKNYRGATPVISPSGFYLLERTGDDSALGVAADLIYTGGLSNTNEALYLFDENCQFEDEVLANPDWPAGNNSLKRTMERKSDFEWQTSANPGGTPKRGNSLGYVEHTGGITSPSIGPQISLSYSQQNPVNKEIEVTLSASNLKNATYDVKISIEDVTTTLSDIYNKAKKEWQSSYKYATSTFSGTSFSGNFKLKIKQEKNNFRGETDIFAKIRDSEKKTIQAETSGKINITDPIEEELPLTVVINEIAWMGTAASSTHQWIELYNNKEEEINLSDWQLSWDEGNTKISLSSTIPPQRYFLMVRGCININTASEEELQKITGVGPVIAQRIIDARPFSSVYDLIRVSGIGEITLQKIIEQGLACVEIAENNLSGVQIDFTYRGDLNASGTVLELRDSQGILVDKVDCKRNEEGECIDWFAGKNEKDKKTNEWTRISMERISTTTTGAISTNWASNNLITRNGKDANGNNINGTPKSENSVSKSETEIFAANQPPFDEFDELTLTYLGSPYTFKYYLQVPAGKTLNIEPGVILKFDSGWGVEVEGTLRAIGQESKKIIFTSLNELNYWNGIYFSTSSTASELNWTEIEYGRRNPQLGLPPAILVESSSITLTSSTVEGYTDRGLKLINSSSTIENVRFLGPGIGPTIIGLDVEQGNPTIKNSYFKDNKYGISIDQGAYPLVENNNFENNEIPIFISYNSSFFPTFRNNTGSGNQNNVISIRGIIFQDTMWEVNSLPYFIYDFIEVLENTNLVINPGVRIEFNNMAYLSVYGTLIAQGTDSENVIFSGFQPPWKRIYFSASSTNSVLENVVVKQGGYDSLGQIYVEGNSIEFKNSTSSDSFTAGIYLENSSSIIQNSYFGNNQIGIRIQGTEKIPQIIYNTFENNTYDIYWPNGSTTCESLKADTTLKVECGCCRF